MSINTRQLGITILRNPGISTEELHQFLGLDVPLEEFEAYLKGLAEANIIRLEA